MKTAKHIAPRLLEGRLALVTGAGQGNGRAIAVGLALAGARVVVTDINGESVADTAAEICASGGRSWAFPLDVCSADACCVLAKRVGEDIGKIDLLVNNAGIIIRESIDSPNAGANLERTLKVNVQGTFNVTHACLSQLRATKGTVVNIASIAAFSGIAGTIGYSPSKGAVKMLTQSLAAELAVDGIRVNAIAPGVIATPMTESTRQAPERLAKFMARTPLARVADPEELVGPVVFLSSDMASYITGVTLPVDGGFLAA
jgi:NAD(P)-dependent dehydrogenase (short-subunit alcohol dehydrogenase family)